MEAQNSVDMAFIEQPKGGRIVFGAPKQRCIIFLVAVLGHTYYLSHRPILLQPWPICIADPRPCAAAL